MRCVAFRHDLSSGAVLWSCIVTSVRRKASKGEAGGLRTTTAASRSIDRMLSNIRAAQKSLPPDKLARLPQAVPAHLRRSTPVETKEVVDDDKSSVVVAIDPSTALPDAAQDNNEESTHLRHTLLDDSGEYFPPAEMEVPALKQRVPGEPIVPPGFMRYRLDVQYQGHDFNGWYKTTLSPKQSSSSGPVIDDFSVKPMARRMAEDALAVALDVDSVDIISGVLPEAGAHVRRLPCHVDIPASIVMQPRTILQRASLWLEAKKAPLALLSCHRCKNQAFHARHSGVRRVYVYRIQNRVAPPLFDAGLQWHVDRHLDTDRMARFAERLQGTMDYGYFADSRMAQDLIQAASRHGYNPHVHQYEQQSRLGLRSPILEHDRLATDPRVKLSAAGATVSLPTIRTIDSLRVTRQDDEVLIWFVGKSFLRRQIRNMVSLLRQVGHGQWTEQDLDQAIREGFMSSVRQSKRERLPPAPAHGLHLWDVEYLPLHASDYVPYVDSGPYEASQVGDIVTDEMTIDGP
jgi:tRNA pseudouridine38-40 synthase